MSMQNTTLGDSVDNIFKLLNSRVDIGTLEKRLLKQYVKIKSDKKDIINLLRPLREKRFPSLKEVEQSKFILDEIIYSFEPNTRDVFAIYCSLIFIYGVCLGENGEEYITPQIILARFIESLNEKERKLIHGYFFACHELIRNNDWIEEPFKNYIKSIPIP